MHCNVLVDPACLIAGSVVKSAAGTVTGGILGGIARAVTAGIRWIIVNTAAWWIQVPSPDLSADPAVSHIQAWLLPVTAAVAAGGVIAAGLRMAVTRRANPLLDLGGGLLALAAATAIGATVAALLLKAGDAWSGWVLQASTGGHFTRRMVEVLDLGGHAAPAVVLVFGVISILLALVQAVLMLFRQAALIVLAGTLPLAAAGAGAPMTRAWVRKVAGWMLALICYKPAAAAVYAAAFTMIGSGGGPRTALTGFAMLALSIVALPALMKFFTWTTGTIASSGGGGGSQFLGTAAMGAVAVGAMRSSPGGAASAAQDQASYLSSRLGPGGSAPSTGAAPPPGPAGPGTSGPAASPSPASQAGPPPATGTSPPAGTGTTPAGPAPASAAGFAGTPAGQSAGAAAGAAATGAAFAGGPAAAAAAAGAQAAARAGRKVTGAMDPGDTE